MKIGVYAGSFDPVTRGHLAVIEKALKVVDVLHVLVSVNSEKSGMFTLNERVGLLDMSIQQELPETRLDRVIVSLMTKGLTVEYAKKVDATIMIRGLRNGADYAYERSLAAINSKLAPGIETIFIQTPVEFEEVSSSTVKGLMRFPGGEVAAREFVTPVVLDALRERNCF
jgi:pantetheine-phosphate adenylyltransferase